MNMILYTAILWILFCVASRRLSRLVIAAGFANGGGGQTGGKKNVY